MKKDLEFKQLKDVRSKELLDKQQQSDIQWEELKTKKHEDKVLKYNVSLLSFFFTYLYINFFVSKQESLRQADAQLSDLEKHIKAKNDRKLKNVQDTA